MIAIDGPAAAGKTTVARALADRLGATYLDTGLLYRAVTLAALRAGFGPDGRRGDCPARPDGVTSVICHHGRQAETEHILLNGELVTPALRTAEIDRHVSAVSAHPGVRVALLPIQRRIAGDGRSSWSAATSRPWLFPTPGSSLSERERGRARTPASKEIEHTRTRGEFGVGAARHRAARSRRLVPGDRALHAGKGRHRRRDR